MSPSQQSHPKVAAASPAPCGACKFLRRRCVGGCVFAPHFGSSHGAARFAGVHKVFGASNVSKLLMQIPQNRRRDAVATIAYEAQARLADPVLGCVSTILMLKQQLASLQCELAMLKTELMNNRIIVANALIHYEENNTINGFMGSLKPVSFSGRPSLCEEDDENHTYSSCCQSTVDFLNN